MKLIARSRSAASVGHNHVTEIKADEQQKQGDCATHDISILPVHPALYAVLRKAHTLLAYLLFLAFLAHLGAVLFHTLILRDRLLKRMALSSIRRWSS